MPSTVPTSSERPRRARRGCLLLVVAACALPLAFAAAWWQWHTTVTLEPVAPGDGWVAFQRRVDYAFPADADTSVWLGRSLADRGTWHRLAPTDAVRDARFTWVTPRHLRIDSSAEPSAAFVRRVEDVTIEWR